MSLEGVLLGAKAVAAGPPVVPGVAAVHYPPPESLGTTLPCLVIEAVDGDTDIGGAGTDLEVDTHRFRIHGLVERDNLPARYPVAVRLYDAIRERFRVNPTLDGAATVCVPTGYTVGARAYAGQEYTGVTVTFEAEDKFEGGIEPD